MDESQKPRMTIAEAMKKVWIKPGKYGNRKTEYNGRTYDSKLEANYAAQLDKLKHAKNDSERVTEWIQQVRFTIAIKGTKVCDYYADFVVTYADGRVEVVDAKGVLTDVYKLKKKLMKIVHNIDIIEV